MKIELYSDNVGCVEYISHMGDDLTIANAARVSFGAEKNSLDEKDKKLIDYLMRHNHTSPFEHCTITMRFIVPLFIRSQHHRHRTWAYNEISRRYTSVDMKFYTPKEFRTQHKSNRQASNNELIDPMIDSSYLAGGYSKASEAVSKHHTSSISLYNGLLDAGVCREQARGILPQNLYTQYYGTVNLHNLLKFVSLRMHEGAQWEIQEVAKACLALAETHFPYAVKSWRSMNEVGS